MFPKTPLDFQHEGRKSRPLRLQIELLDASTKQLFAVLPEDRQFRLPSPLAGKQRGGLRPQPVALEEIVDDAASQPELQGGLLHTLYTGSRLRGQRADHTLASEPAASPLPPQLPSSATSALKSRNNFHPNFVRAFSATFRNFSSMNLQFKSRKQIDNKQTLFRDLSAV